VALAHALVVIYGDRVSSQPAFTHRISALTVCRLAAERGRKQRCKARETNSRGATVCQPRAWRLLRR
jgi:hypothetical protein